MEGAMTRSSFAAALSHYSSPAGDVAATTVYLA